LRGHEIGCALQAISQWLDRQRPLVSLVAGDLRRQGVRETPGNYTRGGGERHALA
jgi:hypothetical protein